MTFSVDILEKSKPTSDGNVLVFFDLGDFLMMTKIDVTVGKMVDKVVASGNFEASKFLESFGTDAN